MNRTFKNILVTGGAGFIGSNFIRVLLRNPDFTGRVINLDALTYAGNPESLDDVAEDVGDRYLFVHGDICDAELVNMLFTQYGIDAVCHLAAESHVDRSIHGPAEFVQTNVVGTFTLLEAARTFWKDKLIPSMYIESGNPASTGVLFHHVSTDEVYGSLDEAGNITEFTPYNPRSPYASSKASSDHLVRAYFHTYGLPVTLTNCSNNYGPYQFPEKLIPVMVENMLEKKPLPVYGDGKNIRDWLYVEDHNSAVWDVMTRGILGESYNIGGENEWENLHLVHRLCDIVEEEAGVSGLKDLITFVTDRPGHDRRYAIDCSKIKRELGWKQSVTFDEGLRKTVRWYLENRRWIDRVKSGEYRSWMDKNYKIR